MRLLNVDVIICDRCTRRVEIKQGEQHDPGGYGTLTLRNMQAQGLGRSSRLSKREQEIVALLVEGKSNKQIARDLECAATTIKVHLRNIMRRTRTRNRTQVAMMLKGGDPNPTEPERVTTDVELSVDICAHCVAEFKKFMQNGSLERLPP